ncbi:MAG: filamentous hemagglutinin N-terminal domain-containing protein, partial [Pseudomonadota bacterium]
MNKHLHRIVFNRARGLFMAVAEHAGTHQAGQPGSASLSAERDRLANGAHGAQDALGLLALTLGLMLAWGAIALLATGPAQAQIKADSGAPGNQQPHVTQAANGVPLVNIQTPSAAGVSRNTYKQFDVQQPGVILNNSSSNVQTQLGGWVQGNPWMSAQGARIILNEVTSGSPSQLQGFIEVAGRRAQVVVTNPAGITCNGCGFINAHRSTLTTGTPIMNNGNLEGYRVTGGTIQIEGAGLQGQDADYTDLIARAVKVNAGLWAQNLTVTTGINQVSADVTSVTPLDAGQATGNTPAFALDTSQLGGMYAGKIVLVGTEAGLGMRNAGVIGANAGTLVLSHDGTLSNTGTLQASTALALDARTLDNQGEISAQSTSVNAGTLTNTGLIDGQDTTVRAATLNNLGAGRIYGDHVAVAADTLVQTSRDGSTEGHDLQAPVIAARQRLDIGAQAIENNEHAWLYSLGDLSIGGALAFQPDGSLRATGTATRLDNLSGTIEAGGDLFLNAATVRNINTRFATATQTLAAQGITEYAGSGSPNRYVPGTPGLSTYSSGGSTHLATPEGNYEQWLLYQYTRNVAQDVVTDSAPAHIMAGGSLHIQADSLLNDNSRIVAGADLVAQVGELNNQAYADGRQITQDAGQVTSYWRERYCKTRILGACVDRSWRTGSSTAAYAPAPEVKSLDLSPLVYAGQTPAQTLPDAPTARSLPGRGLLVTNPVSSLAPLIEVDPRFANQKQWLSSDYMLTQLSFDPATVQKRLGDGFYEQSLVRDQVAQLTGRRFLDGYSNEEAQYRALLDNGVTLARELNLRPGVTLSAEQVAQLTSDVIWLETTTVMLKGPDGQDQAVQVLTPRLYLVPRADALRADGVLMGARNVDLRVQGDLANSGSIGAAQALNVQADTIRLEGGRLSALGVDLQAAQDILSLGGQVEAVHDLSLLAGRDIRLASTTASSANAQGSATYVDRVASLYVGGSVGGSASGPGAQMVVAAQRDLILQAASVAQQGKAGEAGATGGVVLA